ncbi:MAG: DUF4270 domain-containing protein [Bacteroidales bacterium]|nr:DUF4270 domain-containing protein [Bacteroidales bacterium]
MNYKKIIKNTITAFVSIISCVIVLVSCTPENDFGLDVQPPGDELNVVKTDTILINAYTRKVDSLRTDETSLSLLGHYTDPIFGELKASFCTQLLLSSTNVDFGTNPVIDSVILHLQYHSIYGNVAQNNPVTVEVRDLQNNIKIDSNYYSFSPINAGELLGTYTYTPNAKDSVIVEGKKLGPQLRIPLDKSFGQRIIDANLAGHLASDNVFQQFFHGICVLPVSGANGSISVLNIVSQYSGLTIYYHNDLDTSKYRLNISTKSARYCNFEHFAYAGASADLLGQLNGDTLLGQQKLFLQPLAGTEVVFKLPSIKLLNKDFSIVINRAELILPVDASVNEEEYPRPAALGLVKMNEAGKYFTLLDASSDPFGKFDKGKNAYRFIMTKQIQKIITGGETPFGFVLLVSGSSVYANRVVLNGPKSTNPMRLEITYTPIQK